MASFASTFSDLRGGLGLANPNLDSFPVLLGANNLAICASNSMYPAMYTKSMLFKEENITYDVITIEYLSYFNSDSIYELADQLRHRYPDAILIVFIVWALRQFIHKAGGKRLHLWLYNRWGKGLDQFMPYDTMNEYLDETTNDDWQFTTFRIDTLKAAAKHVNRLVLEFDLPNPPQSNNDYLRIVRNDDRTRRDVSTSCYRRSFWPC